MAKITILGTGLIGTSIGLALKNAKLDGIEIIGHDREPNNSKVAQKRGAIDTVEWNLVRSVREADMVIVATPVLAAKELLGQIAEHLPDECVVTDTGSTKAQVLQWAEELLPKRVSFVGGHPLAGREASGPDGAQADILQGAYYCIIPGRAAAAWSVQAVVALVEAMGAKPFFIDAAEHDSFVAAVSHLPLTVSAALVASTTKSPSWHEMSRLAATGYRDVTRLASGDPEMNRDICMTNAREITAWVDRLIAELREFREHLDKANGEGVARFFARVYEEREKWVAGVPLGPPGGPEVKVPGAVDQMSSIFLGDLLARKSRQLMQQYEEPNKKPRKGWWR